MIERLDARLNIRTVTDAVNAYVDAQPALGEAWKILHAIGYHDEGAPLQCGWSVNANDGSGLLPICDPFALASGVVTQFYTGVNMREALVIRFGQTLRFTTAAKTAAKVATCRLVVEIVRGETPHS